MSRLLIILLTLSSALKRGGRPPTQRRRAPAKQQQEPPTPKPCVVDATPVPDTLPHILHADADLVVVDKPAGWTLDATRAFAAPGLAGPSATGATDADGSGVACFGTAAALKNAACAQRAVAVEAPGAARGAGADEFVRRRALGTDVRSDGAAADLRARLAARGAPVKGDAVHGCGVDRAAARALVHCERVALADGRAFAAPLPADMAFLEDADARRDLRRDGSTTCFREVHGAADGAPPNLAVDRYGSHLLVQRPEEVSERARDEVLDGLAKREPFEGVYEIVTRTDRSHGGQGLPRLLRGAPAPRDGFAVAEHGCSFHVELGEAKLSTGLFLDQRPQRAWLARHANNRTVLNLFAHAGAYSVAAAVGGAARTLSVDCDRKWLAYEAKSLAYNGVANPAVDVGGRPFPKHDAIYGDCFAWLRRLANRGETFDVVMLDPPSTSTVNGKRWSAQRDYGALAALCAPLVNPDGGLLCATTNARKLRPRKFARVCSAALDDFAADRGLSIVLDRVVPPAVDYPVLAGQSPEVKNLVFRFERR